MSAEKPLLSIQGLVTEFITSEGRLKAVNEVSFDVHKGKTLCVVGESGCGKSVCALSIMRLVPSPPGVISAGSILFDGTDLLSLSEKQMRKIRGNRISMIFQEPMTSLNPVLTIESQITEMFKLHRPEMTAKDMTDRTIELLQWVGIPNPKERLKEYPHQLSGGMRQRVMIAMALSCEPDLLIADEPSTALDVTIQAQILELINRIQSELHMSVMLITHDFGVVSEVADEVVIMYAGRVVESGTVQEIFEETQHPYTYGLLKSIPDFSKAERKEKLYTIPGTVPALHELPSGCPFSNRCGFMIPTCQDKVPELIVDLGKTHPARCIRPCAWDYT